MALLSTDPIDLELDDNGQLIVPLRFVRGVRAVAQGIRVRVRMLRGEWFLNLRAGVGYFETEDPTIVPPGTSLLGSHFNAIRAQAEFRDAILRTPGVDRILALDVRFDNPTRELTVSWRVQCSFGDIIADKLSRKE